MNIDLIKNKFYEHAKNYDLNELAIYRKLYHSYRVTDFCALLAKYNNFDERDIEISVLVGLLHDYSRLEQWTKYKTYSDINSIDHGDLAVKRLFEDNEIIDYCDKKEYYDEIYDAIKYHNKYKYPNDLSEHNKLLCKVIRDADKLDIFYLLGANKDLMKQDDNLISDIIRIKFFNNEELSVTDVKSSSDSILLSLAMIYDLNFKYSFDYIKANNLIDKMFDNIENKNKYIVYFDYIKKYIDERIDENA